MARLHCSGVKYGLVEQVGCQIAEVSSSWGVSDVTGWIGEYGQWEIIYRHNRPHTMIFSRIKQRIVLQVKRSVGIPPQSYGTSPAVSVSCHSTQVNAPTWTPAWLAGTRFNYPGGMEGWV